MVEYGKPLDVIAHEVERLQIPVVSFDAVQAQIAVLLCNRTRAVDMSLGDRACISLAMKTSLPAFTTEGDWLKCNLGVDVIKIR